MERREKTFFPGFAFNSGADDKSECAKQLESPQYGPNAQQFLLLNSSHEREQLFDAQMRLGAAVVLCFTPHRSPDYSESSLKG